MKKFLLMAVAALAMLATACTKDEGATEPIEEPTEQTSEITFTVSTIEYFTRAFGDGSQATNLHYAVYDQTTKGLLFTSDANNPTPMSGLKAEVKIPFVNGMSYDVLFWAENAAAPYDIDWERAMLTYDTANTLVANQEAYDGFFCYHEVGLVSGPVSEDIKLKRPFAQLNIATADYTTAGVTIAETKITAESVYTSFDLRKGKVSGTTSTVTFDYATKAAGSTEVDSATYENLAVCYLLVSSTKSTIDVTMECKDASNTITSHSYGSIPVQQNYKTNVVGNLLTSGTSSTAQAAL